MFNQTTKSSQRSDKQCYITIVLDFGCSVVGAEDYKFDTQICSPFQIVCTEPIFCAGGFFIPHLELVTIFAVFEELISSVQNHLIMFVVHTMFRFRDEPSHLCKYRFVSCNPHQGSTRYDAVSLRCLSAIFSLTLHSFGNIIQRQSDPTSKSLLGILRDLRIIVDVLANMNQSSRRSCVEDLAWGDFPNACAARPCHVVTFPLFSGSARDQCDGDVR
jgi:hypothetical protein